MIAKYTVGKTKLKEKYFVKRRFKVDTIYTFYCEILLRITQISSHTFVHTTDAKTAS